ncbi:MAG: c-type cytochrome [bacterium]|nr:c-type cytochrome [bacterium]
MQQARNASRSAWALWALTTALLHGPAYCHAQEISPQASPESAAEPTFETPPAPALRPAQEMETFRLVDGYRLELVAADPLVQDPIAMTFDPRGRLWVCEMRGFMPDIEGNGEDEPVGVVTVLDDTDGDGVMDKSTEYVGGLVLPRGVCWTMDGVLVCENGTIWLCRDHDGNDICDEKIVVATYNPGNLEHALNGLMPALDNWIYNAKEGLRLRRVGGAWIADSNAPRGQWGMTQDDLGYLYYNVNASLLRGDLVPCYTAVAQHDNPYVDAQLYDEQVMFPIRPTPGINRGYIEGFLRPDGSLIEANANCGPVVYRGDNLPAELIGNVFIPEPAGNLIRRQIVESRADGTKTSHNAYDQREFMASTDERFRPVNMYNAPDGTLYVVDMYRGIIQHGAFITPYLREQILSRELDKEINLGRIYRIVHESTQKRQPMDLLSLSSSQLVALLEHPNGWHRDMAQQILVQRGDKSVVNQLERMALKSDLLLARMHALWTLEGLHSVDPDVLYQLLFDGDENIRATAVTLYGLFLPIETMIDTVVEDLSEIANDPSKLVQLQIAAVLGLVETPQASQAVESILRQAADDEDLLAAVLSGFADQQAEFLFVRLSQPQWSQREAWREKLLGSAAEMMWSERTPMSVLRFVHLVSSLGEERQWQQIALLEGIKDPAPVPRRRFPPAPGTGGNGAESAANRATDAATASRGHGQGQPADGAGRTNRVAGGNAPPDVRRFDGFGFGRRSLTVRLATEPEGLDQLRNASDERLAKAANALAEKLIWPGKDGQALPQKPTLTEQQQRLYELGKQQYATVCAGCHHIAGYGLSAKGPELLGSEWLQDEQRLTKIVLNGVQGPITIHGQLFNADNRLSMPGMAKLMNDEQLAGVLTYVRREFTDDAPPVSVEAVQVIRSETGQRTEPWRETELIR